ncbi:unnamed protein product [Linum trigynum]|uniref:Uncharacterized protein n=1 Tax=Linum trigynum TaxID=586398 RepID=A0AAV2GRN5_9ROSI
MKLVVECNAFEKCMLGSGPIGKVGNTERVKPMTDTDKPSTSTSNSNPMSSALPHPLPDPSKAGPRTSLTMLPGSSSPPPIQIVKGQNGTTMQIVTVASADKDSIRQGDSSMPSTAARIKQTKPPKNRQKKDLASNTTPADPSKSGRP